MSGPLKRYVVMPDAHVPYHDQKAWNVVLKSIRRIRPHGFICLGDFGECHSVSRHEKRIKNPPPLEYLLPDIHEDIIVINDALDEVDECLAEAGVQEKIYIQGNHDRWFDLFVESYPYLAHTEHPKGFGFKFVDMANIVKRGYKFVPIGKFFKLGKLHLYHGHLYAGIHHTRNHLLRLGVNVLYGDKHDVQESSITHIDGAKGAWSIGCIKSLRPEDNEWLGGRPINWGHAFAIVDLMPNGLFTVHVVRIVKGMCSLWGEIIQG